MNIVLVDDDALVVRSLGTILSAEHDIAIVGTALGGTEAVDLYENLAGDPSLAPDIVLMDIRMPHGDGLTAGEAILSRFPAARIVYLTTFSDDDYIVRALRMGAAGYLIKSKTRAIAPALRSVMAGQTVLGGEVTDRVGLIVPAAQHEAPAVADRRFDDPLLTERERLVVELVAQGLDNKEIGSRLFLSEGTVRNHISSNLMKLGLENRTQIAVRYWRDQARG